VIEDKGIKVPYLLITLLSAALLTGVACQTARRPAARIPAQAGAPVRSGTANSAPKRANASESLEPVPSQIAQAEVAPPRSSPPNPDPVGDLIAQAEREYQAGQQNYKSGHLEAAQQNFDRALDLLGSQEYLLSDERVQREFDKILETVNSPELAALQQNDNSAKQQPAEPAPIDEVNEVTPAVDANVRARAEAEIKATHSDLPLMLTDPVAGYINYFSGRGRGVLERGLARSGRYRELIQGILRQEGVPQDLIYLAQAESGFYPQALSRVGARGMWQFMSSRARGYGLSRDQWLDERQDPEKATRAAAHHLRDLYNEFGDWYLAMAAYNSGPGTIQQAVKRTGYADFWELYKRNVLPKETRNYVPIILAVTIMTKNPAQYGLGDVVAQSPIPYDTVSIDYAVDLRLVAQCVDAPVSVLQDLNPSLLRLVTPSGREFELRLPMGTKDAYLAAIERIPPAMRLWWRYHQVLPGDTLASIARAYRTSPKAIAQENDLRQEESLQLNKKLIIPIAPGRLSAMEDGATYVRRAVRYKVRRGDTVQSVADNFGVPPLMVRRWNHLRGDGLGGRRVLYVHLPVTPQAGKGNVVASNSRSRKNLQTAESHPVVRHRVKTGETLNSIASTHHTTVAALKRDNRNLASLKPGMVLIIRDAR
jgi:membrane-bound lytic murein transglycosylase D